MGGKVIGWLSAILCLFLVVRVAIMPLESEKNDPDDGPAVIYTPVAPAVTPTPAVTPGPAVTPEPVQADYVLNLNSMKFHIPTCESVEAMNEANKEFFTGTRQQVLEQGFEPCQNCYP